MKMDSQIHSPVRFVRGEKLTGIKQTGEKPGKVPWKEVHKSRVPGRHGN
jgi:hypothetical protein